MVRTTARETGRERLVAIVSTTLATTLDTLRADIVQAASKAHRTALRSNKDSDSNSGGPRRAPPPPPSLSEGSIQDPGATAAPPGGSALLDIPVLRQAAVTEAFKTEVGRLSPANLFPMDLLAASFRFVRRCVGGKKRFPSDAGGTAVLQSAEWRLQVKDLLPRVPRVGGGVPLNGSFTFDGCQPDLVVIDEAPPPIDPPSNSTGGAATTGGRKTTPQPRLRHCLAQVFVVPDIDDIAIGTGSLLPGALDLTASALSALRSDTGAGGTTLSAQEADAGVRASVLLKDKLASVQGRPPPSVATSVALDPVMRERLIMGGALEVADENGALTLTANTDGSRRGGRLLPHPRALATMLNRRNANTPDFLGRTLLHDAVLEGNGAVVSFLTSLSFVDLNLADQHGDTALHHAVCRRDLDLLLLLLDANSASPPPSAGTVAAKLVGTPPRLNALMANQAGHTPLHLAIALRLDTVVECLCRWLAEEGRRTMRQLQSADGRTSAPLSESLSAAAFRDRVGFTPVSLFLHLTPTMAQLARQSNVDAMRALYHHELYPKAIAANRSHLNDATLLHEAAEAGQLGVVRLLLEELPQLLVDPATLEGARRSKLRSARRGGTGVSAVDGLGRTPLHLAARCGHDKVALELLQAGSDPLATDGVGRTPLHAALYYRKWTCAQVLLRATDGFRALDQCDMSGIAPLHLIACSGSIDVVRAALGDSADPTTHLAPLGDDSTPHHRSPRVAPPLGRVFGAIDVDVREALGIMGDALGSPIPQAASAAAWRALALLRGQRGSDLWRRLAVTAAVLAAEGSISGPPPVAAEELRSSKAPPAAAARNRLLRSEKTGIPKPKKPAAAGASRVARTRLAASHERREMALRSAPVGQLRLGPSPLAALLAAAAGAEASLPRSYVAEAAALLLGAGAGRGATESPSTLMPMVADAVRAREFDTALKLLAIVGADASSTCTAELERLADEGDAHGLLWLLSRHVGSQAVVHTPASVQRLADAACRACSRGDVRVVEVLLESSVIPAAAWSDHPPQSARSFEQPAALTVGVAQWLSGSAAGVELRVRRFLNSLNPMSISLVCGRDDVFQRLLSAGVRPTSTVFAVAAMAGRANELRALSGYGLSPATLVLGHTVLWWATLTAGRSQGRSDGTSPVEDCFARMSPAFVEEAADNATPSPAGRQEVVPQRVHVLEHVHFAASAGWMRLALSLVVQLGRLPAAKRAALLLAEPPPPSAEGHKGRTLKTVRIPRCGWKNAAAAKMVAKSSAKLMIERVVAVCRPGVCSGADRLLRGAGADRHRLERCDALGYIAASRATSEEGVHFAETLLCELPEFTPWDLSCADAAATAAARANSRRWTSLSVVLAASGLFPAAAARQSAQGWSRAAAPIPPVASWVATAVSRAGALAAAGRTDDCGAPFFHTLLWTAPSSKVLPAAVSAEVVHVATRFLRVVERRAAPTGAVLWMQRQLLPAMLHRAFPPPREVSSSNTGPTVVGPLWEALGRQYSKALLLKAFASSGTPRLIAASLLVRFSIQAERGDRGSGDTAILDELLTATCADAGCLTSSVSLRIGAPSASSPSSGEEPSPASFDATTSWIAQTHFTALGLKQLLVQRLALVRRKLKGAQLAGSTQVGRHLPPMASWRAAKDPADEWYAAIKEALVPPSSSGDHRIPFASVVIGCGPIATAYRWTQQACVAAVTSSAKATSAGDTVRSTARLRESEFDHVTFVLLMQAAGSRPDESDVLQRVGLCLSLGASVTDAALRMAAAMGWTSVATALLFAGQIQKVSWSPPTLVEVACRLIFASSPGEHGPVVAAIDTSQTPATPLLPHRCRVRGGWTEPPAETTPRPGALLLTILAAYRDALLTSPASVVALCRAAFAVQNVEAIGAIMLLLDPQCALATRDAARPIDVPRPIERSIRIWNEGKHGAARFDTLQRLRRCLQLASLVAPSVSATARITVMHIAAARGFDDVVRELGRSWAALLLVIKGDGLPPLPFNRLIPSEHTNVSTGAWSSFATSQLRVQALHSHRVELLRSLQSSGAAAVLHPEQVFASPTPEGETPLTLAILQLLASRGDEILGRSIATGGGGKRPIPSHANIGRAQQTVELIESAIFDRARGAAAAYVSLPWLDEAHASWPAWLDSRRRSETDRLSTPPPLSSLATVAATARMDVTIAAGSAASAALGTCLRRRLPLHLPVETPLLIRALRLNVLDATSSFLWLGNNKMWKFTRLTAVCAAACRCQVGTMRALVAEGADPACSASSVVSRSTDDDDATAAVEFNVSPLVAAVDVLLRNPSNAAAKATVSWLVANGGLELELTDALLASLLAGKCFDQAEELLREAAGLRLLECQRMGVDAAALTPQSTYMRFLKVLPTSLESVPPVLHRHVGPYRHAAQACCAVSVTTTGSAMKDALALVLRYSLRADVELSVDATGGQTALFLALRCGPAGSIAQRAAPLQDADADAPSSSASLAQLAQSQAAVLDVLLLHARLAPDLANARCHQRTPLMAAAMSGRLDAVTRIVRVLSDETAAASSDRLRVALNRQDERGYTALMWACKRGHHTVADFLVSLGVINPHSHRVFRSGETAAQLAALGGYESIALPLVKHWSKSANVHRGPAITTLHAAAIGGCTEVCRLLVDQFGMAAASCDTSSSADPSKTEAWSVVQQTPLQLAQWFGRHATAKLLAATHPSSPLDGSQAAPPPSWRHRSQAAPFGWMSAALQLGARILASAANGPGYRGGVPSDSMQSTCLSLQSPWWWQSTTTGPLPSTGCSPAVIPSLRGRAGMSFLSTTMCRHHHQAGTPRRDRAAAAHSPRRVRQYGRTGTARGLLLYCARSGNVAALRAMCAAAPSTLCDEGCEALRLAARRGHADVCQLLLLARAAKVDGAADPATGRNALHEAVCHGNRAAATVLLDCVLDDLAASCSGAAAMADAWLGHWLLAPYGPSKAEDASRQGNVFHDFAVAGSAVVPVLKALVNEVMLAVEAARTTTGRDAIAQRLLLRLRDALAHRTTAFEAVVDAEPEGISAFEAALLMGNPAAAWLLSSAWQECNKLLSATPQHSGDDTGAKVGEPGYTVTLSAAYRHRLPPSSRALLVECFGAMDLKRPVAVVASRVADTLRQRTAASSPLQAQEVGVGRSSQQSGLSAYVQRQSRRARRSGGGRLAMPDVLHLGWLQLLRGCAELSPGLRDAVLGGFAIGCRRAAMRRVVTNLYADVAGTIAERFGVQPPATSGRAPSVTIFWQGKPVPQVVAAMLPPDAVGGVAGAEELTDVEVGALWSLQVMLRQLRTSALVGPSDDEAAVRYLALRGDLDRVAVHLVGSRSEAFAPSALSLPVSPSGGGTGGTAQAATLTFKVYVEPFHAPQSWLDATSGDEPSAALVDVAVALRPSVVTGWDLREPLTAPFVLQDIDADIDAAVKKATFAVRKHLSAHPLLKTTRVTVEWGANPPSSVPQLSAAKAMLTCHGGVLDQVTRFVAETSVQFLPSSPMAESPASPPPPAAGSRRLPHRSAAISIESVLEKLVVTTAGASASSLSPTIVLAYTTATSVGALAKMTSAATISDAASAPSSTVPGRVWFNDQAGVLSNVPATLIHLRRAIAADVNLAEIHLQRMAFLDRISRILRRTDLRDVNPTLRMTVEGGADLSRWPVESCRLVLDAVAEAVKRLVRGDVSAPTCTTGNVAAGGRRNGGGVAFPYLARNVIRKAFLSQWRAIVVTCRPGGPQGSTPGVRFHGGTIFLTLTMPPATNGDDARETIVAATPPPLNDDDVYNAVSADIAATEIERLTRDVLPGTLSDLTSRLQTYCPTAQLVVDAAMIQAEYGDDLFDWLEALSTLLHGKSELVLRRVLQALSLGWDGKLGAVVRSSVSSVVLRPVKGLRAARLQHIPNDDVGKASAGASHAARHRGSLTYFVDLLCRAAGDDLAEPIMDGSVSSPLAAAPMQRRFEPLVLSAHGAASALLLELMEQHPSTVAAAVNPDQALSCWSSLVGPRHIRTMVPPRSATSGRGTSSLKGEGATIRLLVQARNAFHESCAKGGADFRAVAVYVTAEGESAACRSDIIPVVDLHKGGQYRLRLPLPTVPCQVLVFVTLDGQLIAKSPVRVSVGAGPWSPDMSVILPQRPPRAVPFPHPPRRAMKAANTVVAGFPFSVFVQTRDAYGNAAVTSHVASCASRPPAAANATNSRRRPRDTVVCVEKLVGQPNACELRDATDAGDGVVQLRFMVQAPTPSCLVACRLCPMPQGDTTANSEQRLSLPAPFVVRLPGTLQAVNRLTYLQHIAWRYRLTDVVSNGGQQTTSKQEATATSGPADGAKAKREEERRKRHERVALYFRSDMRRAERRRIDRDGASVKGMVFPSDELTTSFARLIRQGARSRLPKRKQEAKEGTQ